jgi:hypothetical protein
MDNECAIARKLSIRVLVAFNEGTVETEELQAENRRLSCNRGWLFRGIWVLAQRMHGIFGQDSAGLRPLF